LRCRECGLVFIHPQPVREELRRAYGRSYYSVSQTNPEKEARILAGLRPRLALARRNRRSGRLLDIGCGSGLFLKLARESGFQVTGLDRSEDLAAYARRRFDLDLRVAEEVRGSGLPEESFEMVTLWHTLEHLRDPRGSLDEIRRLLVPGGHLITAVPNLKGLVPRYFRLQSLLTGDWVSLEPPVHLFEFTPASLGHLLRKTGFREVSRSFSRCPRDYAGRMRQPLYYRWPYLLAHTLSRLPRQGDWLTVVARKPGP